MKAEEYESKIEEIEGWKARITTYRIGDCYHCMIDNVDPGARVARAEGTSREEAERSAREDAARRLARTRRTGV